MRALIAPKFRASRSARATERRKLLTSASKASTPSKPRIYAPALLRLRTGTIQRWMSTTTTIRILPPSTKTCKRADGVLVLFPNSDLRTAKLRPALVVQADNLNTGLPQVVVAMISSKRGGRRLKRTAGGKLQEAGGTNQEARLSMRRLEPAQRFSACWMICPGGL